MAFGEPRMRWEQSSKLNLGTCCEDVTWLRIVSSGEFRYEPF